jgi:hypothetical protein
MEFLLFVLSVPAFAAPAPKIDFAVKDGSGHRIERVLVQGDRNDSQPKLSDACAAERSCSCEIYFEDGRITR